MEDMVLLAAILVVGPFIFFTVMVCILKLMSWLNLDKSKPGAPSTITDGPDASRPSNAHRYTFDEYIDAADLNEPYLYGDRWMTGLSIAARLPIHIAVSDVELATSTPDVQDSITSIPIQRVTTDYLAPDDTRSIYSEPPPDYHLARILEIETRQNQQTPPPSYNDCVQMGNSVL